MVFMQMPRINNQKNTSAKIPEKDRKLLWCIDRFKVLTVSQLSALSQRSPQVIRRRLRALAKGGYTSTQQRAYGNKRGRPEDIILLSKLGLRLLHGGATGNGKHPRSEKWAAPEFIEHELLVNWFLIHLIQVERQISSLSVHYITQHFSTVDGGRPSDSIVRIQLPRNGDKLEFIPDAIFTVSDSVSNKTLLLFLEVDMGTETLASPTRGFKDVRQKIINYQGMFRVGRYKRYERYFQSRLNGFRLLFIAHSPPRLKALCKLTASMPPSGFIWLSDRNQLLSSGLIDEIWIRGGILGCKPSTILGKIRTS